MTEWYSKRYCSSAPSSGFGQNVEGKFDDGHIVPQVLFLEALVMLVLPRGHSAPGFGNDVGEGCILLTLNTTPLPFVGELFANLDTLDALVNPFLSVAKAPVISDGLLDGELRILNLVNTIGGNLSHP